jgi:acyl-CoA synthetase (AMP-forming)/AMP-acid ligase II
MSSVLTRLRAVLAAHTDRPAFVTAGGRTICTAGDLDVLAGSYTGGLHARGLREGDTLALAVRPGVRSLAVLLAAHALGLRVVAADPKAGADVLTARMAAAGPSLLLADAVAQAAAGWAGPLARRAGMPLPRLTRLAPVATLGRRLPGCAPVLGGGHAPQVPDGDRDAFLVPTSGTTGVPRTVVHTTASLTAGVEAVAALVDAKPGRPVLGGSFFVLVPGLLAGAPVCLPARTGRGVTRQLAHLRPQVTYLTPPQARAALAAGARFTGRSFCGSAPVSAGLLGRLRDAGAEQAWGVYALTELFPAAAVESRDKLAHDGDGDLVGSLLPGVTGNATGRGVGELQLSGPSMATRYLGAPPHHHVCTGDLVVLPVDPARVVLAGRCKDMVLRGAENIYPGLHEPALHVAGVELAVLVGIPADDGNERLVALVQPLPGADHRRVRAALREPLLRMGSARPDAIVLHTVPLTGRSDKPDRVAAARLAADLLQQAG